MSFLRSLVVSWKTRMPALRCGEVVISLIRRARGIVVLRAVAKAGSRLFAVVCRLAA